MRPVAYRRQVVSLSDQAHQRSDLSGSSELSDPQIEVGDWATPGDRERCGDA